MLLIVRIWYIVVGEWWTCFAGGESSTKFGNWFAFRYKCKEVLDNGYDKSSEHLGKR